jgi:mannitol/fructose-specific phosphotransferase system IIA component (Ntr-type)
MTFWKIFKPAACSIALKASMKDDVLREVVGNLVSSNVLEAERTEAAIAALLERESLASTGVGMSVAIPHVRLEGLERAVAALSVHKEGLEWAAVDGEPVHILFTVLRPGEDAAEHDPEQHLEMMRWIARLSREGDFRSFALQAKTKKDLVDLLKEMSHV